MATTEVDKPKITKAEIEAAKKSILFGEPLPGADTKDAEAISIEIAQRIFGAETFEEAFNAQELQGWQELMDVPVLVRDVKLNSTGFEVANGSSIYAVVDLLVIDKETGEFTTAQTVTCGGRNVLAQLVKMLEQGWMDRPVKLAAKGTAEGYQALWLVPA